MEKMAYTSLILLLVLLTGCSRMKEPEFRGIENFRIADVNLTSATVKVNVVYFNPNSFNMTVKETSADVYLDDIYMGKFTQDTTIAIGDNRNFSIPISGTVSLSKLLQLDLKNIGSRDLAVQASGSTKVGKAGIYVTKPFSYEGKHRLNEINF